jgi:hypothetical protein
MQDMTPTKRIFGHDIRQKGAGSEIEAHKISQGHSLCNEPEQDNQARHAKNENPCPIERAELRYRARAGLTYSISRLAHHRKNRKNTARTKQATLLAFVSKPHTISAAPIRLEPRYPAGSVSQAIPPDICVAPPSSAIEIVTSINVTTT